MPFSGIDYLDLAQKAQVEAKRAPTTTIQNQWQTLVQEYLKLAEMMAKQTSPCLAQSDGQEKTSR